MKIKIFIVLAFLSTLSAVGQENKQYTIRGEMTRDSLRFSPEKIKTLYLTKTVDGVVVKVDSAKVVDKKFSFTGVAPEEFDKYYITGFDNGIIEIYLEPGNITIEPFDGHFPLAALVGGTKSNEVQRKYIELLRHSTANVRSKNSLRDVPKGMEDNKEVVEKFHKASFFQNTVNNKMEIVRFVKQNINSPVALHIMKKDLFHIFSPKVVERQLLRSVPEHLKTLKVFKEMENLTKAASIKVGSASPDIEGTTIDGKPFKLSDLKGKYVFLDFWASWCAPCRREIPFLKKVMEAAKNYDKFVTLSYSLDTKEADWKNSVEANKMKDKNWIHISTLKGFESDAVKFFNIKGIPYTVLLNPRGEIIAFDLRGEEMVKKITNIIEGKESFE